MRFLRRLRAGLPDGDAAGEVRDRDRPARTFGGHHLRLLRRRLLLQGGNARRGSGPHGAVEGRQGQSRPFLRQGPFRLGLRHPSGPDLNPMVREKITDPWREVSWEEAFAHVAKEFRKAHPVPVRQGRHRRHHLVALHQRGDLPGAEAGARRLRQQQCRHLRPRLPFAHRLRPRQGLRHLGRHPGFRFRRAHRRGHRDRRQPDRRPPGVRLAAEEAAAPGRQADRHRSAPHRSGAFGRMSRRAIICR
jgi:hypothetical protein